MNKNKKPRLAEVLGVKVGENFQIYGVNEKVHVDKCGILRDEFNNPIPAAAVRAINKPDLIIRDHFWTTHDIADASTILALIPSAIYAFRDIDANLIVLFRDFKDIKRVVMAKHLIPSIPRLSAVVKLTDIIGDNE